VLKDEFLMKVTAQRVANEARLIDAYAIDDRNQIVDGFANREASRPGETMTWKIPGEDAVSPSEDRDRRVPFVMVDQRAVSKDDERRVRLAA
jgi:hypothetical protein